MIAALRGPQELGYDAAMRALALVVSALTIVPACDRAPDPSTRDVDAKQAAPPGKPDAAVKQGPANKQGPPAEQGPPAVDPCGAAALGLANAAALALWHPPPGCTPHTAGTKLVRSEAELKPLLECTGTSAGIDFSRHALLSIEHTLSPAGAGLLAFDDGKAITLVTRQRSPCPDDPRPMPMNTDVHFLAPAGERTIATKVCTLAPNCR